MMALLDGDTLYGVVSVNPAIQGLNILGMSDDFVGCPREHTASGRGDRGQNMYLMHGEPKRMWDTAVHRGFMEHGDTGNAKFQTAVKNSCASWRGRCKLIHTNSATVFESAQLILLLLITLLMTHGYNLPGVEYKDSPNIFYLL